MTGSGGRTADRPSIRLRPATPNDANLLLAWANEPATRAASLQPDPIDRSTHEAWLAARLTDPECRIWIGSGAGGEPVGVVRFELGDDGRAAVSIAVAAEARARGVGRELLLTGLAAARADLRPRGFRARIRADNAASVRLFRGAGFRPEPGFVGGVGSVLEFVLDDADTSGAAG